jgi:hypothetical protein
MTLKLGGGGKSKSMSLSENVRPLLAARAATDPDAERLLEIFTKADEILSEDSLRGYGGSRNASPQVASGIAVVIPPYHSRPGF